MPIAKSSSLVDTRVIYCGHNFEQLRKLPAARVDLIYIDPEKRTFEDTHESTKVRSTSGRVVAIMIQVRLFCNDR